jgi:hypothetical protein
MEHQLTADDIEFMRWLDSKEGEQYWDRDEKGEKVILRPGWYLAQKHYNEIKKKTNKSNNGLEK